VVILSPCSSAQFASERPEGQIKLALKAMGWALDDEEFGRVTWHLWFDKAEVGSQRVITPLFIRSALME
jgi:hypothetical protein